MAAMVKVPEVAQIIVRLRGKMKPWGLTISYLARQLGVSRQYAWQILHYETHLSVERAMEIENVVDGIIAARRHIDSFGKRLRAARISAGLTLKEVASMIGYSWVGVQRWEKDVCIPKPGVLWHLAQLYGPDASWILGGMMPQRIQGHKMMNPPQKRSDILLRPSV
jgi:transcriptional regulator with XRE-family HTH domain